MTILSLKNYSRPALGSGRKFKRSAASSGPICQETFTLLQEGVVVLNQQGIILSYNPAFAAMTGVPLNLDLRGQSITRFLPGEFSGEFHALVELLAYAEEPIATSDFDLVTYHGVDRPVRMSIARMQSADYTHLTFLSLDENLKMQDEINRAQFDLEQAYSATLEGWAKALELRDLETEGHSRRVTDMTVELAIQLGFSLDELLHIRHGALLHDIGKMAISDKILLKPGKLSADEWEQMKMHTVYAFNLLNNIEYLRPALTIPHFHHEHWDGSGYPEGLTGEQIPISARLFSVVDVFDALTHPRVYRPEVWEVQRVMEYLEENAGSHFDPEVIREFKRLL